MQGQTPKYIPFLEACGNILKLNPTISLSIAAYTDSVGDEEFNLELSQRRAQAVVDFFIDFEIDNEQLIGTGLGQQDLLNPDITEEDNAENRRALLELIGVMEDA